MVRSGSLVTTALFWAPFALCAGCNPTIDVGAMDGCGDPNIRCDLNGNLSDATLPIGDAQFGDFDRAAYDAVAIGIAGDWHGVAAGLEQISSPFEMHFSEASADGTGEFSVHCLESNLCVPLGAFVSGTSTGQYRLMYVDDDHAGEGEFFWTDRFTKTRTSIRFRNLLLQRSDQVLFFVIDASIFGSFQIVMQRGPWPDGGVVEDAGAMLPIDAGASSDGGVP